jgi:hypothetical protein
LFGVRAGLAALALWCGSPNIIAHAQMITPDIGATSLGLLASYVFWNWLKAPSLARALWVGLCLGLALLAKFTWVVLPFVWIGLWLFARIRSTPGTSRPLRWDVLEIAILLFVATEVISIGYGFDGIGTPIGRIRFHSRALAPTETHLENRFSGTWIGRLPTPVPVSMLEGIDMQKQEFDKGYWSYLRGEWRYGGWWYYYLYAWMIKEPLGFWGLVGLAGLVSWRTDRLRPTFADVVVLAPAFTVLVLVSAQTGFNHHLRYILPAFPFVFIAVSRVFRDDSDDRRSRIVPGLGAVSLASFLVASVVHSPHHLSYFNEVAGGAANGPEHLLNSNLDWGQDLLFLKEWADHHPEARPLQIVFRGGFRSESLKVWDARTEHRYWADIGARSGSAEAPKWLAISVSELFERPLGEDIYAKLRRRTPNDRAGETIYIYKIDKNDIIGDQ